MLRLEMVQLMLSATADDDAADSIGHRYPGSVFELGIPLQCQCAECRCVDGIDTAMCSRQLGIYIHDRERDRVNIGGFEKSFTKRIAIYPKMLRSPLHFT